MHVCLIGIKSENAGQVWRENRNHMEMLNEMDREEGRGRLWSNEEQASIQRDEVPKEGKRP